MIPGAPQMANPYFRPQGRSNCLPLKKGPARRLVGRRADPVKHRRLIRGGKSASTVVIIQNDQEILDGEWVVPITDDVQDVINIGLSIAVIVSNTTTLTFIWNAIAIGIRELIKFLENIPQKKFLKVNY